MKCSCCLKEKEEYIDNHIKNKKSLKIEDSKNEI